MASPTKKVRRIRRRKAHTRGRKRKAQLRIKGTTQSAAELFDDSAKK